jgi:HEAT repeat protein
VLSDHNVRPVARKTLIRIGKSTVNVLVDAVGEDNVRFDILVVLRKVDPAKAMQMGVEKPTPADLPSLQLVLNDTTRPKEDRESAATSLAALGQAGFDELIKAFEHTESARTAAAAFSQADPSAVPQLVVSLKHKEPKVRATTADAIGHLGPTAGDAAAELIRMLKDRDRDVRYHAVRALHELGHAAQPAISALTAVILDSKELEPTRQWALKTLVVTLPDTREMVVKSLIEANSEEINYGVKQLARQLLLKVAPSEAKAAGIK